MLARIKIRTDTEYENFKNNLKFNTLLNILADIRKMCF